MSSPGAGSGPPSSSTGPQNRKTRGLEPVTLFGQSPRSGPCTSAPSPAAASLLSGPIVRDFLIENKIKLDFSSIFLKMKI